MISRGQGTPPSLVIGLHQVVHDPAQLIRPAHVTTIDPDLGDRDGGLGADHRLDPGQHFIKGAGVADHVVVHVVYPSLLQIVLAPPAVRATLLAEQMIARDREAAGISLDDGLGENAPVQGMTLTDDASLHQYDGRVPSSSE